MDENGSIWTVQLVYVFLKNLKIYKKITASCRSPDFPLLSCLILSKDKNLSDGYYTWRLFSERWAISLMGITTFPDFRELSFSNLRVWRCNFRVKWTFTERVSWVRILKEKSARKESGGLWRIRNQSPPASNSTYSPRTGTSLIEMSKISGNISEKDYIFTEFLENFPIFPTSPGHAQTWCSKILVFLLIFFLEISLYFLPVQAAHKDRKSVQFFLKKTKDTSW